MLLTLTCTTENATDLGYLLHKHPERVHTRDLPFGTASVFYPEATDDRCTAALLLEMDPVQIIRSRRDFRGLEQYVNDRPYVASSFLSVAIARSFGTALSGRSRERPELVAERLPLRASVSAVRCRSGEELIRRLFEPLGYDVEVERLPLDDRLPGLGDSPLYSLEVSGRSTVRDMLGHLYVLLPVIDDGKHYYVDEAEIDKLLRRGEGWLAQHPQYELITRRYLLHRRRLTEEALTRLAVEEEPLSAEAVELGADPETPLGLNELRLQTVAEVLSAPEHGVQRVIDLGCGGGALLRRLLDVRQFTELVGLDVSPWALARAERLLRLDRLPEAKRQRLALRQGSLLYRDDSLSGYDAAAMVEVIEHIPRSRLADMEQVVFGHAHPRLVVVTTPNAEYNVRFASIPPGGLRHRDHDFEWTRAEFAAWAETVGREYGYSGELRGIGPSDPDLGPPTQMAVFTATCAAVPSEASALR